MADSEPAAGKVITIGRGPDNDVVLRDSNVSTKHARLIVGALELTLEDLGSTNGTSVGSVENKISRATVLSTDTVFFGSTPYRVSDLLSPSEPLRVAPAVQVERGSSTRSSKSSRLVMAVAAACGVLLIIAVGWLVTREPSASETAAKETPTSAPNSDVASAPNGGVSAPPQETEGIPTAEEPNEEVLSPEETLTRSLFLIVCTDSKRETPFRVGTGFAIDAETIVTSASVIQAMRSLQQNGFSETFLYYPAEERELQIVSSTLHPQFEKADAVAQTAQQTHDAIYDRLESEPPKPEAFEAVRDQLISARLDAFEAMELKATYDVAVIKTSASLDHWLPGVAAGSRLRPKQKVNVTGYAFDMEDPFFDPDTPFQLSSMPSRIAVITAAPNSSARRIVANGSQKQYEFAYLGSPVLNAQGQVVAIYSRPTPPDPESEGKLAESFDAAFFNLVGECRISQQSL